MPRTRESTTSVLARAIPQTLSDGSVAWNVQLYDDSVVVANIGVCGGEKAARMIADKIERHGAWAQEGRV